MDRGDEAMLLYDMDVEGIGNLRVVEHFTVRNGRIVRLRQVHDTEPIRGDYSKTLRIDASAERVFEHIATLEGIRGWWTPIVAGSTDPGGEIHLGYAGMDEHIVMRVVASEPPRLVRWVCLRHTGAPEWDGSRIHFELREQSDGCELRIRHHGVPAEMVSPGWERFLGSLARLAETGTGKPFVSEA
jgi:uncharacterized protein YndB with AHSA1/START domain